MDATPIAGHRDVREGMPHVGRNDTPAEVLRRESTAWGLLVHPSLMPTVFTPSGGVPAKGTSEK